jgi:hypothetical protein
MPKIYPLASEGSVVHYVRMPYATRRALSGKLKDIRAVRTGEHRPPKAGEWFLSGNPIEAYFSFDDLSSSYPIAKLVLIKEVTSIEIVPVED